MIFKNITRKEYNKLPGVNASRLKPYYESSLNGNYELSKDRTETPAMRFGTACHCLILEPDTFLERYQALKLPINEKTGKEYGVDTKRSQDYIQSLPKNKIYLSQEEFDTLDRIYLNIQNNESAITILNFCKDREMAITWTDEKTGIKCKALIDFCGEKIAGDLKTTREIKFRDNEEGIAKLLQWDLIGNKNLLQFSFYFDGLLANGLNIEKFAVIFAKNNGNCETLTALLSDYSIDYGRLMYERAIKNYLNKDSNQSAFNKTIEI